MKLSIVIPVLNQLDMFRATYDMLRKVTNTTEHQVEFIVIDNGCDEPIDIPDCMGADIYRNEESIGVYTTFKQGMEIATGDIVAFFHSDLVVWEENWNVRVMELFARHANMGLVGFIGSNEIDSSGGRGSGTTSNFQGLSLITKSPVATQLMWVGSPASAHGGTSAGFSPAAVVDGCAMIVRREAWNQIGYQEGFPPHHFYDRLISTQMLQYNWQVGVLGIACDHFSGQTTVREDKYHRMAEKWSRANLNEDLWQKDSNGNYNWDATIYLAAEKMWLSEYRERKHHIPVKI